MKTADRMIEGQNDQRKKEEAHLRLVFWCFCIILLTHAHEAVGADRAEPTVEALIEKAGNVADDGLRKKIIREAMKREGLSEDLKTIYYRLNNRGSMEALEKMKKSSPLYPMACFHRGSHLLTKTIQYAQIWHYEDRHNRNFAKIKAWFKLAAEAYPDMPVVSDMWLMSKL